MADLQGLYIDADWGWGYDVSWLDNVKMWAAPVPTSVLLFGSGLVRLVGLRRKFKKAVRIPGSEKIFTPNHE